MITVTPAVQAAIEAGNVPQYLVKIDFDGITLLLTDAAHDVVWGGETWISGGLLVDGGRADMVNEVRALSDSIVLTGVDQAVKALILGDPARQSMREVTVYEAILDSQGQVIPSPYIRDMYFIDSVQLVGGIDSDTVALQLAGEFADFEYRAGVRTTNASLQRVYPGDKLMEFSKAAGKPIKWGGK